MKHTILICLCAGALLLTGCSNAKKQGNEPIATIPVYEALPLPDVRMDIPEGFEETSSQFYEKYYISDDASIIITEDTEGPFHSAYDYSIKALNEYKGVATTVDVLSNEFVDAQNCGVQLMEFRYTLGDNAEADMTSMVGFTTDGTSMFIVTCKSNTTTYEQHRDEFHAVMESLMLTTTGK